MQAQWGGGVGRGVVVGLALVFAAGCSGTAQPPGEVTSEVAQAATGPATPVLNTFQQASIEIDQLGTGADDANLVVGSDPADGTASAQKPVGGSSYLDWSDLGSTAQGLANHRLLDLNDATGKDPTSFPQSNECVGPSQVLGKMDLTYVAASHNGQYAYLAVQRSDASGDAAYYWLFTRAPPRLVTGQAPCKSDQSRLLYDFRAGDVMLVGHFHPGSSPLLRAFRATASTTGTTALGAVDFGSSLWAEDPSVIAAVAVNTTATAPGTFGAAGVSKTSSVGSNLGPELFAEAALSMSLFSTGGSSCGSVLYGTVITRSSGSGGTSPDLKDLAGPAVFNLVPVSPAPTLAPSCAQELSFAANVAGYNSNDPALRCAWSFFKDGSTTPVATASVCDGRLSQLPDGTALPAGAYTATVAVTGPGGCTVDSAASAPVQVVAPATVTPVLASTCGGSFTYQAQVSGGSNPSAGSLAWTFTGAGGTPTPGSATTRSGSVAVSPLGVAYTAAVTYTDPRTDLSCSATASAQVTPSNTGCYGLTLSKSVSRATASPGDALSYTLNWSSSGQAGLSGVTLTDPLPAGETFVSASGGGTYDPASRTVTWSLGAVAAGASGSLSVAVQLAPTFPAGSTSLINTATLRSDQAGPAQASATTVVSASPDLGLTKVVDKATARPGDQLTYTLSYGNYGNADASGVVVTDALPARTTFVSASSSCALSAGVVSCSVGAVPAQGSGSVTIVVRLDATFPSGTTGVANTAVIAGAGVAQESSNTVTTAVVAGPQLSLTKTAVAQTATASFSNTAALQSAEGAVASASAASPGVPTSSRITYTLSFSNQGNANATGVVLSDPLPSGTSFVSASDGGTYDPASRTVTWSVGTLASGASATRTLVVTAGP